jgi:hypothetical protein
LFKLTLWKTTTLSAAPTSAKPAPAPTTAAGFIIGKQYHLSYTREFDQVRLKIPHGSPAAEPLVLTVAEFEKWFVK